MTKVAEPDPEFAKKVQEGGPGGDTLMLCYQCGTCTGSCPSGQLTAFRTRQLIRKAQLGLKDEILPTDELWLCTTCYACVERCPREVEITEVIFILRNMAVKEGYMSEQHKRIGENLMKHGATVPVKDEVMKLRVKMGLPEYPPSTVGNASGMESFRKVMVETGFDKLMKGGKK